MLSRSRALVFTRRISIGAGLAVLLLTATGRAGPIAPGATLVEQYSASRYFEGPTWDPIGGKLYFSALSGGEQILRLDGPGTVAVWMDPTSAINGTFLGLDGRLLCAQQTTRRILSAGIGPDGPVDIITLAHDDSWDMPNDLCQTFSGDIYFTTPDFASYSNGRVYRISPFGAVTPVISDMPVPNGIIASNDGRTLYVSDSSQKWWRSYPIHTDGTIGSGSLFFNPETPSQADPDGMTIDELGNLYFAGRGGVWIVSPAGGQLEMVPVPQFVSNVTFGGADGRTLFLTCQDKLYSLAMEVRGANWRPLPPNDPPQVDAGPDQIVTTWDYQASLSPTVVDDGLPNPPGTLTVRWTKTSGPGTVSFGDPAAVDTTATFSAVGIHVLRLTAYDGSRTASDDLTVTVAYAGDLDLDLDVDTSDAERLASCHSGPALEPPPGCGPADLDGDHDVDQADFGYVQRCLSGPGVPPSADCWIPAD